LGALGGKGRIKDSPRAWGDGEGQGGAGPGGQSHFRGLRRENWDSPRADFAAKIGDGRGQSHFRLLRRENRDSPRERFHEEVKPWTPRFWAV